MPALSITPADVRIISGTAKSRNVGVGVTVTAGQLVTIVNNLIVLASRTTQQLSGGGTGSNNLYIAAASASEGQPLNYLEEGELDLGVSPIEGSGFVLGDNGDILPWDELAEDDWVSYVGYGNSSQYLVFNPQVWNVQRPMASSLA